MKILSLDLGVTSCGFSVINSIEQNSYKLQDFGVVMRDNPSDGGTQKDRSGYLQSRSLKEKKKNRVNKIKTLFILAGLNYKDKINYDIWYLRAVKSFNEKLSNDELFALFRYFAKHRGYKSLKIEDLIAEIESQEKIGDCEGGEIIPPKDLEKFSDTLAYLDALKCKHKEKTVAQILWEIESASPTPTFRNHDNYRYMIRRDDIGKEIETIVRTQHTYGFFDPGFDIETFIDSLKKIILYQAPVRLNEALIGNCTIYKNEKCAPIYSLAYDRFNAYKLINDLKIGNNSATSEQKERLIAYIDNKIAEAKNLVGLSVKELKAILDINDEALKLNNHGEYRTIKGKKEPNHLIKFSFVSKLSKFDSDLLKTLLSHQERDQIFDQIATIIQRNINPENMLNAFKELFQTIRLNTDEDTIRTFALSLFKEKKSGSGNYSFKALGDLTRLLLEGKNETDAKTVLGVSSSENYESFAKGIKYLHVNQYENDEAVISNHIVKSIASWAIRIIKDLHDKHGPFDQINIESTRELSQPEEIKRQIKSSNDANEKEWQELIRKYTPHAIQKGINLSQSPSYVLKLKLWEQQKFFGIYSHQPLGIDDILSEKTEIEHIVPRACGGSNAEYNKAVDLKNENMQKGNRLPLDYLHDERRSIFIGFVAELKETGLINWKKMKNLLAESLDETYKEAKDTISLHATSYAEKLLGEIIKRYYPFMDESKRRNGIGVMHISGRATSYLRRILSIENKSRDTNFHHAEDAIILGLMSRSYLQNISTNFTENYAKTVQEAKENFKKIIPLIDGAHPNEIFAHLRKSYEQEIETNPFYKGLDGSLRIPSYWVSKKPIGTKAHNETIQSAKNFAYYVPVASLLGRIKPNHKMHPDDFKKSYDTEVLEKLQVFQTNPKDHTAKAFVARRDETIAILNKANFITSKDEQSEIDKALRSAYNAPILDVNGNPMRRVKRVGEEASISVRGGVAYTAPSLLSMRCEYADTTKLVLKRIDIRAFASSDQIKAHQIDIYNNDLIEIFIIKSKSIESKVIGILKGFTESKGGRANIRNPKFPALKEKQPKIYQNEISIGSICGIKKYKTDATGKVLGFYYLGRVKEESAELFSPVVAYRKLL
ncbi:MAG: type II CRISPR RNA-guided endonuclease Cas9 [Sulfuricurvum sp.]|nr:type II CRISPR RNA-guided endonuclease Cas9 [Sulfuricurvum sp.]